MILGIGIDSVEIHRFEEWKLYSPHQLSRIFPQEEISYCLTSPLKNAERFAARFAAREAFYKALHVMLPGQQIPFFRVCKSLTLNKLSNGAMNATIDWHSLLEQPMDHVKCHVSWTHTKTTATAMVILEKA